MKGVVFHDFFSTYGGGEKTALVLAECLHADIITTSVDISENFFNSRPVIRLGNPSHIPGLRQSLCAMKFRLYDWQDMYDYAIYSGNWAHHASRKDVPSLYYCQDAPVRALYDLYPVFLRRQVLPVRPFYAAWASLMRRYDQDAVTRVSCIIANSRAVQKRVQQYYSRTSLVIYPPVDTHKFSSKDDGGYWLSVNRLYPEKRVDLQIEAFSRLPHMRLVIVGGFCSGDHSAGYAQKMIKRAETTRNITILSHGVGEKELLDLYAHCTGVICTSRSEAFGMVPVEAMASGKPVIAVAEGGFLETVTLDCGIFIHPDLHELISAIKTISNDPAQFKDACIHRASQFDISRFSKEITDAVKKITSEPV
jgi:glycosyltransferase involved in cell wall biosynthesis